MVNPLFLSLILLGGSPTRSDFCLLGDTLKPTLSYASAFKMSEADGAPIVVIKPLTDSQIQAIIGESEKNGKRVVFDNSESFPFGVSEYVVQQSKSNKIELLDCPSCRVR